MLLFIKLASTLLALTAVSIWYNTYVLGGLYLTGSFLVVTVGALIPILTGIALVSILTHKG